MTTPTRPTALLLVAACTAMMLAACARPAPADTAQPAPAPAIATPTSEPPGEPPATSSTKRDIRCRTGQLHVDVAAADNAAGHKGLRIVFTNTSSKKSSPTLN